jgi:hypothetical protein
MNYLFGLALKCDPPDLCLLSSWDYRREPSVSSPQPVFALVIFYLFIYLFIYSFIFAVLGFELKGLTLTRQVLCHLSYVPSASVMFWIGSRVFELGWAWTVVLYLCLPFNWDYRNVPPHPTCWLR